MNLSIAGICHIGRIREKNEDNIYINSTYRADVQQNIIQLTDNQKNKWNMCAVCDGMGGESHGEMASLKAVESFRMWKPSLRKEDIEQAFQDANENVYNHLPKVTGQITGTTAAIFISNSEYAAVCNIGDSRIYRFRDGCMEQISRDHTVIQQMIDFNIDNIKQSELGKRKGMLTQYLGISPDEFQIEPFICTGMILQKNDIYLICSDGLTDMLNDEKIRAVIEKNVTPEESAATLVEEALYMGGRDNVSVIIVKVL